MQTSDHRIAIVRIGTSALTRDLVWCQCGRGLSLSGKWHFCPSCGCLIDQQSYHTCVEQAKLNGASHYYKDPETLEQLIAADAKIQTLTAALKRNRQGYLNILEMRKLDSARWGAGDGYGGRYGALTREEIEEVIAGIDQALA